MREEVTHNSFDAGKQLQQNESAARKQNNDLESEYLVCNEELFWKELKVLAEDSAQNHE
jgi:hypothetical protein